MQTILAALLLLGLWAGPALADGWFYGSGAAPSCSCVSASGNVLFHENFRAASGSNGGWCNAAFDSNKTVEANGTLNPNSTTVADSDGGACDVLYLASADNSATSNVVTYATFSAQTGGVYVKFVFRMNGAWADDAWADVILATVGSSSNPINNDIVFKMNDSGSNFYVRPCNYNGCVNAGTIANTNTGWHTLVFKYVSDGSSNVSFKFDGGAETNISADQNQTTSYVTFGWNSSTPFDTPKIYFGQVMVCNASGSADCGW